MYVLFTFVTAHAHGLPLAPIGFEPLDNADVTSIVMLTEGLAQPIEGTTEWRFLCPSLWSGLPDAPLISPTSDGAVAHGLLDAYLIQNDGTARATDQPTINALRVIDTASSDTKALALVREDAQDALWNVDPATRIGPLPGRTTSVFWHQGLVRVTSLDGEGGLLLLTLDPADGTEIERFVWPTPSDAIPEGRSDGVHAWVISNTEYLSRVERWGAVPVSGPHRRISTSLDPSHAGTWCWRVSIRPSTSFLTDDSWVPLKEPPTVQCLVPANGDLLAPSTAHCST